MWLIFLGASEYLLLVIDLTVLPTGSVTAVVQPTGPVTAVVQPTGPVTAVVQLTGPVVQLYRPH